MAGLTTQKGWQDIGYEVERELRSSRTVTIRRTPENSPNVVSRLYGSPLITFQEYAQRPQELGALAQNIRQAKDIDGLSLDRQLVICLGQYSERAIQATYDALRKAGVDVYIAGNLQGNTPPTNDWRQQNRNGFRMPGHVTLTSVARAKGNEADLVHIVGLGEVGEREGEVSLRSQLFVALSRSRGWVNLSGTQIPTGFRAEVDAVLAAGEQITFTMSRPKRDLNDEGDSEPLSA